ncbi:PilZ domain-containing protein [Ramlibacter sp. USB13]|uniref:PilZ domain-containing protein n=1 Tax=Ramlibacter cellulosilyticus TaxID=2764187 RepID=A0A923SB28_9BURK|nr:PilZ domain-containing protein [Ramlibacter cellulosilyticus]MBC5783416.1 PilZ domain-containing protein [Ramlibacter cellulosilyticus]
MAGSKAARAPRDQRGAVRFDTHMPVHTAQGAGRTHNISAQGVYFETDAEPRAGALVNFQLEYTLQGRRHRLLCEGKVVRVERQGERIGVAARLVTPFFEGEEIAAPPTLR